MALSHTLSSPSCINRNTSKIRKQTQPLICNIIDCKSQEQPPQKTCALRPSPPSPPLALHCPVPTRAHLIYTPATTPFASTSSMHVEASAIACALRARACTPSVTLLVTPWFFCGTSSIHCIHCIKWFPAMDGGISYDPADRRDRKPVITSKNLFKRAGSLVRPSRSTEINDNGAHAHSKVKESLQSYNYQPSLSWASLEWNVLNHFSSAVTCFKANSWYAF